MIRLCLVIPLLAQQNVSYLTLCYCGHFVPLVFNPSMSTASSSSGANGDDREEENEEFIREEYV